MSEGINQIFYILGLSFIGIILIIIFVLILARFTSGFINVTGKLNNLKLLCKKCGNPILAIRKNCNSCGEVVDAIERKKYFLKHAIISLYMVGGFTLFCNNLLIPVFAICLATILYFYYRSYSTNKLREIHNQCVVSGLHILHFLQCMILTTNIKQHTS